MLRSTESVPLLTGDTDLSAVEAGMASIGRRAKLEQELRACIGILERAKLKNRFYIHYAANMACVGFVLGVMGMDAILVTLAMKSNNFIVSKFNQYPVKIGNNSSRCGDEFRFVSSPCQRDQVIEQCGSMLDQHCVGSVDECRDALVTCCGHLSAACDIKLASTGVVFLIASFLTLAALVGMLIKCAARDKGKAHLFDLSLDERKQIFKVCDAIGVRGYIGKDIAYFLGVFQSRLKCITNEKNMELFVSLAENDNQSYPYLLKHGLYAVDGKRQLVPGTGNDVIQLIEPYVNDHRL